MNDNIWLGIGIAVGPYLILCNLWVINGMKGKEWGSVGNAVLTILLLAAGAYIGSRMDGMYVAHQFTYVLTGIAIPVVASAPIIGFVLAFVERTDWTAYKIAMITTLIISGMCLCLVAKGLWA